MKRSGPPRRKAPLRRSRRQPRTDAQRERQETWVRLVVWNVRVDAVDGLPGEPDDPLEGHHVVPKEDLKKYARAAGLSREQRDLLLWDPRNGMCIRRSRHDRHTRAVERIPLSAVPEPAVAFAREVGLEHVLERDYRKEPL